MDAKMMGFALSVGTRGAIEYMRGKDNASTADGIKPVLVGTVGKEGISPVLVALGVSLAISQDVISGPKTMANEVAKVTLGDYLAPRFRKMGQESKK